MKFSILVAHYNNFEYFKDCYQSIISQTYKNFEVIILDDCSTDDSYEKVKNLVKEDHRFKVFKNDENKGVGYTKGKLIELASGDICGFLDPDDAITPNAIEESIKCYDDPKIVATYSKMYFCNSELVPQTIAKINRKIKNNDPLFLNVFFEVNHFFTFRKSTYNKITPIRSDIRVAEDQDLYLKLYEKGNFKFIKQPLYLYRRHKNGLSQDSNNDKILAKKKQWDSVLRESLLRRGINTIYGKNISEIDDLPNFVFQKQNTLLKKILRKLL